MATNHPDMQAELLKHKQTHLPKFVWENDTSFADMLVSQELPPCPDDFKPHSGHSLTNPPTTISHQSSRLKKGMNDSPYES